MSSNNSKRNTLRRKGSTKKKTQTNEKKFTDEIEKALHEISQEDTKNKTFVNNKNKKNSRLIGKEEKEKDLAEQDTPCIPEDKKKPVTDAIKTTIKVEKKSLGEVKERKYNDSNKNDTLAKLSGSDTQITSKIKV